MWSVESLVEIICIFTDSLIVAQPIYPIIDYIII